MCVCVWADNVSISFSFYLSNCFNTIRTFVDIEYMSPLTASTVNRNLIVTSLVFSLDEELVHVSHPARAEGFG